MDESKVTMKGRLGPGMMISVDLESGQVGGPDHGRLFSLFGNILTNNFCLFCIPLLICYFSGI